MRFLGRQVYVGHLVAAARWRLVGGSGFPRLTALPSGERGAVFCARRSNQRWLTWSAEQRRWVGLPCDHSMMQTSGHTCAESKQGNSSPSSTCRMHSSVSGSTSGPLLIPTTIPDPSSVMV